MKKFALIAVLCLIVGGGYYFYQQHKRTELVETVSPAIKNATIRITNSSKFELAASNITWKEMFDRLEQDTSEIEKRNIDVQALATNATATITTPAIAYMQDCQELSRALLLKYRKRFAFSNASDRMDESLDDIREADSYSFKYAKKRSDKALADLKKAQEEEASAIADLGKAASKLKQSRAKLSGTFPEDALIAPATLDAIIKRNTLPPADTSKEKAAS